MRVVVHAPTLTLPTSGGGERVGATVLAAVRAEIRRLDLMADDGAGARTDPADPLAGAVTSAAVPDEPAPGPSRAAAG